jgi:hypothetical protein
MDQKKATRLFAFIMGIICYLIIALYLLEVLSLTGLIITTSVALLISAGGFFIIRKTK